MDKLKRRGNIMLPKRRHKLSLLKNKIDKKGKDGIVFHRIKPPVEGLICHKRYDESLIGYIQEINSF